MKTALARKRRGMNARAVERDNGSTSNSFMELRLPQSTPYAPATSITTPVVVNAVVTISGSSPQRPRRLAFVSFDRASAIVFQPLLGVIVEL